MYIEDFLSHVIKRLEEVTSRFEKLIHQLDNSETSQTRLTTDEVEKLYRISKKKQYKLNSKNVKNLWL